MGVGDLVFFWQQNENKKSDRLKRGIIREINGDDAVVTAAPTEFKGFRVTIALKYLHPITEMPATKRKRGRL